MVGLSLAGSIKSVQDRIAAAALRVHRDPRDVLLLAVSKRHPATQIREAYRVGLRAFGENYVQEFLEKQDELSDLPIDWHLIGNLQKNKVKFVAGKVALIHTVDRLSVARAIDRFSEEKKSRQSVLVQVHLGGEETKFGLHEKELPKTLEELLKLENVDVKGLMAMPPFSENPEDGRRWFSQLRNLRDQMEKQFDCVLPDLSMGTTSDFEVAIEEGATIIRVGTSIFGERPL